MRLKDYLIKKKIKQADFGKLIGVDQQAVSRYCRGYAPKRTVMQEIEKVTGGKVTMKDLWVDLWS